MPLDPAKLAAFAVPEIRQGWTRRDTSFYALSIGLGADPLDERQLAYVDPTADLRTIPTMALVIAHPGFWLADPRSGVDPASALHAEQEVEILAPLPCEGRFVSRTEVSGLVDKGPGRAALLATDTTITDEATGRAVAIGRRLTFLKGQGGFGGSADAAPPPRAIPSEPPDHVVDLPTRPEQALFYALNGDDNPLHTRPAAARAAGFPRPILHGLCTMGVVAHALARSLADYDASRIARLRIRFTAPVHAGETVRTEVWHDGAFRARVVERDLVVGDGRVALA